MDNEKMIQDFWATYDAYIKEGELTLRKYLSNILRQIENESLRQQLFRPDKGWNKIIAWQVLRGQEFYFHEDQRVPFSLSEGELLTQLPHWNIDILINRFPLEEKMSGRLLLPGYYFEGDKDGYVSDQDWQSGKFCGDQRGLYLPVYESATLLLLYDRLIEHQKKVVKEYLIKENIIEPYA